MGSHVVEMINMAYRTSEVFGKSIALLDKYFFIVPELERLYELNLNDGNRMDAIIMAKVSTVAFEKPPARLPGMRSRTCVKGVRWCLPVCLRLMQSVLKLQMLKCMVKSKC